MKKKNKSMKIAEERLYYPGVFMDFGPGEKPKDIKKNRKKRRTKPFKSARHNIA